MKKILSFAAAAGLAAMSGVTAHASGPPPDAAEIAFHTRTPIKHLIVVVGENVTFDTLFGTYVPKRPHESVSNLLSKHIVNVDGTPGPRYFEAVQFQETNLHGRYTVDPIPLAPYERLPQPTLIGVFNPANLQLQDFLVEDRLISPVEDHLTGSLAEPKVRILTRPSSYWQVCGL